MNGLERKMSRTKIGPDMKKKYEIQIIDTLCKRCGICVEFCSRKVFSTGEEGEIRVVDPGSCTGCLLCELRCPDFALDVTELNV
jgi:2-oxoglutarate ferredoxin oxidoreductase subunit delta